MSDRWLVRSAGALAVVALVLVVLAVVLRGLAVVAALVALVAAAVWWARRHRRSPRGTERRARAGRTGPNPS